MLLPLSQADSDKKPSFSQDVAQEIGACFTAFDKCLRVVLVVMMLGGILTTILLSLWCAVVLGPDPSLPKAFSQMSFQSFFWVAGLEPTSVLLLMLVSIRVDRWCSTHEDLGSCPDCGHQCRNIGLVMGVLGLLLYVVWIVLAFVLWLDTRQWTAATHSPAALSVNRILETIWIFYAALTTLLLVLWNVCK